MFDAPSSSGDHRGIKCYSISPETNFSHRLWPPRLRDYGACVRLVTNAESHTEFA